MRSIFGYPTSSLWAGIALGFCAFLLPEAIQKFRGDFYPQLPGLLQRTFERIVAVLTAAGLILLIRWLYRLIRHREGIGLGDAKLMALLAAWLGLPGALLAFALGAVLGSVAALALLVVPPAAQTRKAGPPPSFRFGTFLCIGGIVSSLWGQPIIAAYLRWAGF